MAARTNREGEDRRTRRTRDALIDAFNDLILRPGRKDVRVADIVEQANVGRSTFYDHYGSADDLFMEALARPMSILADAVAGAAGADQLQWLLEHFWENRQRARDTLNGERRDRVSRLLAGQIEERLAGDGAWRLPLPLVSLQLAEAALAPIRGWVAAAAPCASANLADSLCRSTEGLREALRAADA